MSSRVWRPEDTFPRAVVLAHLLMEEEDISGVALTGSVARFELAHDIDLVAFSNSGLIESGILCEDPADRLQEILEGYCPVDFIEAIFPKASYYLSVARGEVPVSYILVSEAILWDCRLFQEQPQFVPDREFYQQVFCNIPLLLLNPGDTRHELGKYVKRFKEHGVEVGTHIFPVRNVRHECENEGCKPKRSWKEIAREREERKSGGQKKLF